MDLDLVSVTVLCLFFIFDVQVVIRTHPFRQLSLVGIVD